MFKFIIFLILLIIIFYAKKKENYSNYEKNNYNYWYQCPNFDNVNKVFQQVLKDNGIKRTFDNNWDIYLHCSKFDKKSFDNISFNNGKQVVGYIPGNGVIGSKKFIWKMLTQKYGRVKSSKIMPPSYIFPQDKDIFAYEFRKNKNYVMKTEKQRQKGLKLSKSFYEITNSNNKGFKIVQEYIKNPMTLNEYKLNFRIYILVVCQQNISSCYVYDDGIVSYSNEKADDKIITFDNGVSSFYTSKKLYNIGYPITLKQFMNTKKGKTLDWLEIKESFNDKIYKTMEAAKN